MRLSVTSRSVGLLPGGVSTHLPQLFFSLNSISYACAAKAVGFATKG